MNKKKKIFFKFTLLLIPFIFLFLLELILIIGGFFKQPALFLEENQFLKINPDVGERYFNKDVITVPRLYPQKFLKNKQRDVYRIFCLGGSTTAGFPYEMTVPFPQQLEFLLEKKYPQIKFEVLNLGLSAINSFTVLDWVPEIIDQKPDLIIIYMGHNEFYGAYGSASTISIGQNRTLIKTVLYLQKFRIYQMLKSFMRNFAGSNPTQNKTLMEQVIGNPSIKYESEIFNTTNENFGKNLYEIIETLKDKDIPVILSNLVSNIRDQIPFSGLAGSQTDEALELFKTASNFLKNGDTLKARADFIEAKDKDQIRFRAASNLNRIISKFSMKNDVHFIDMEKAFEKKSQYGIPGEELFCDHLHPNPNGYFLMAKQFFNKIEENDLINKPLSNSVEADSAQYVTPLEWDIGGLKVFRLKHAWPYKSKPVDYTKYIPFGDTQTKNIAFDFVFRHSNWVKAHFELAEIMIKENNHDQACNEYYAVHKMYPEQIRPLELMVPCLRKTANWNLLEEISKKAIIISGENSEWLVNLAIAENRLGKRKEAMNTIQSAVAAKNISLQDKSNALYYLALFLVEIKKYEDAEKVINDVIKIEPDNKAALEVKNYLIKRKN